MFFSKKKPAPVDTPLGQMRYVDGTWEGFRELDGDEIQILIGGDKTGPSQDAVDLIMTSWPSLSAYTIKARTSVDVITESYELSSISADDGRTITLQFDSAVDGDTGIFVEFVNGEIQRYDCVD